MTTKPKWNEALIDADILIKMARLKDAKRINAIELYLPVLIGKIYIHKHIYDNEVFSPNTVKEQLIALEKVGKVEVISEQQLSTVLDKLLYDETRDLLKKADPLTIIGGKNWGETNSLAWAKIKKIPYFISDERTLQSFIDEHLNIDDDKIEIIRLKDIVLGLKELNFPRKEVKLLWNISNFDPLNKKSSSTWAKKEFNKLWPAPPE